MLAIGALLLIAGEGAARRTPAGCYRSYRLIPHHPTDVMHFTNDTVRYFACGTTDEGIYHRASDGTWIWDWRMKRYTNTFILHPHLLWLTCIDASQTTNVIRLPRAFLLPKENQAHD